jgi:copper chaperone NosL
MIINEARFAAAYVATNGETRRFDDIGGMLAFANEQGEEVAVFWVHDYETEAWLKAEEAAYVLNDDLITPMGFGVIAFTTEQQAVAWSNEEGGMVMTFEELREASSSAGMEAGHDHEPNHLSETGSVQGSGG